MPTYQHPGVYLEEIASGVKPIEGVATAVAAFVGWTTRGPVEEAVLIHSFDDYEKEFGPIVDKDDAMGLAVSAFYLNGGKSAYVMRLVDGTASAKAKACATLVADATAPPTPILTLKALSEGEWGNGIRYKITQDLDKVPPAFSLEIGHIDMKADGTTSFKPYETYKDVSMDPNHWNYAITAVNNTSRLVGLRLDKDGAKTAAQSGLLKGVIVGETTGYFSDKANGTTKKLALQLNISLDGRPHKLIELEAELNGTGANAHGKEIAEKIQAEVRKLSASDPFEGFRCTYESATPAGGHFELTSPASASASVSVTENASSILLGLSSAAVSTRHGSAPLVPASTPASKGDPILSLKNGKAEPPRPKGDYENGFEKMQKVRDVSIVVLPGKNIKDTDAITAAESHCRDTGSRMLLIDPPDAPIPNEKAAGELGLPTSSYTACYYPWIEIPNPFYHPEKNPTAPKKLPVPPSAFIAGLWSRIDGTRGVWKAPAGVEATLAGAVGLADDVGDDQQNQLNPLGINCIRKLPNFGSVVWGARTLATHANPEWRYVPVRRTAIMIEQSIYNGIQWAVFEPNDHRLWSSLRVNIGSFMDGLFRAGAFQGEKASDAYFVRCGLGDTMTQGDIDRGQVIAIVGFAPLKPAEFVIVRIQQKVQQ